MKYMRDAIGDVLLELGERDRRVVVLDADLGHSTRAAKFGERFPERYFEMGIAEQNMVGVAAGLAAEGKVPFVTTFAVFGTRAWEQARLSVAYSRLPVKFLLTHAGLATGPDGASHQMAEDIALFGAIPGMRVWAPSDYWAARAAIRWAYEYEGPGYVRMVRPKSPLIYEAEPESPLVVHGKGKGVVIMAHGLLVPVALEAKALLEKEGIEASVYDFIQLKPLPEFEVEPGGVVLVAEDHVAHGGLASMVAPRLLEKGFRGKFLTLNLGDRFGESGETWELYSLYGFTAERIAELVKSALS